jgi:hypothetical protein
MLTKTVEAITQSPVVDNVATDYQNIVLET